MASPLPLRRGPTSELMAFSTQFGESRPGEHARHGCVHFVVSRTSSKTAIAPSSFCLCYLYSAGRGIKRAFSTQSAVFRSHLKNHCVWQSPVASARNRRFGILFPPRPGTFRACAAPVHPRTSFVYRPVRPRFPLMPVVLCAYPVIFEMASDSHYPPLFSRTNVQVIHYF